MNVKWQVLWLMAITGWVSCIEDDTGLQIEIPFGNPYKDELNTIRAELVEVYHVVKLCVDHFLIDLPLASGFEIETNCVGRHFSIVNHIFQLKMKKSMKLYNKALNERFEQAFSTYPDEIAHFMSLYKMFIEKGFYNIFDSMQLAKRGSKYYVREDIYESLLELSKDSLEAIGEFSTLLVQEKNKIRDFITEQLVVRDENLKVLLRVDKGDVSETEAHEEVQAEEHAEPKTLAERIKQMGEKLKENMEETRAGSAMDVENINSKRQNDSGKYVPFNDKPMPIPVDTKANNKVEAELLTEFTPEAIKLAPEEDEEAVIIDERKPVAPASEPTFKDELEFYYDRNNPN